MGIWAEVGAGVDRVELTYRLRRLGMKKPAFAKLLGMSGSTVYQWGEVPQYAVALLEALEDAARLRALHVPGKPVVAAEKKPNAGQFKKREGK